jgi:adenylosuccinate synthase
VMTPYHGIASRVHELARGKNPRGTIGTGVGEAFRESVIHPDRSIRARHLNERNLRSRLEAIREAVTTELRSVLCQDFEVSDLEHLREQTKLLFEPSLIDWTLERFAEMIARVRIVDSDYLRDILRADGTVVVESSHGLLTDSMYGFVPHTSKLRTMPSFTHDLIREYGYDGAVHRLGVHRAYQIRHGAGPMVTHDPAMSELLLPGSNNDENRWQGKVRVGALDFVSLRYAVEASRNAFDGIALTWFDQIQKIGRWDTCSRYEHADPRFFNGNDIVVSRTEDREQLDHQAKLTQALFECTPVIDSIDVSGKTQHELVSLCDGVIREKLGLPVCMISFGPTEREKVCL